MIERVCERHHTNFIDYPGNILACPVCDRLQRLRKEIVTYNKETKRLVQVKLEELHTIKTSRKKGQNILKNKVQYCLDNPQRIFESEVRLQEARIESEKMEK